MNIKNMKYLFNRIPSILKAIMNNYKPSGYSLKVKGTIKQCTMF